MSSDPFKNLAPDQAVRVLPRHLAGPGPTDLRTAWPFPFDADWSLLLSEEGPAFAVSPCLRLWTSLVPEPDQPRNGRWTITACRTPFGPATWRITFDATTPVELLHDVHTELLDVYDLGLFEDETEPHEAYKLLLAHGWSHRIKKDGTQTFSSPEGLGAVRHRYASTGSRGLAWTAWGGYPNTPDWRAQFSFGTPPSLVAAFTASLISTEPVRRTVQDIPVYARSHLYVAAATTTAKPTPPSTPAAMPPPDPVPHRNR
ncbi:protein of unknown function DUF317 [Actinobacteria bacterium OK074]|nr:protein of unknown function DUF317 [Actinobacteria bacterium OK074]